MKKITMAAALLALNLGSYAVAQDDDVLTCSNVLEKTNREVTEEARQRFKDLKGSCEGVVEMNGAIYLKTTAVVRRASSYGVTLYVPATDHTFTVQPQADRRVLIGNEKVRPHDLASGQEIQIHVALDAVTNPGPVLGEIGLVTESETVEAGTVEMMPTEAAEALPTTG